MPNEEDLDLSFLDNLEDGDEDDTTGGIDALLNTISEIELPEEKTTPSVLPVVSPPQPPAATVAAPAPVTPVPTVNPTPATPPTALPKPEVHPAMRTGRFILTMKDGEAEKPFDPRQTSEKGWHRNAYLRKHVSVETIVSSHNDLTGKPLKIGQHLILNKDDKVRVSASDVAIQAYARNNVDKSQPAPPLPVRFALRRGWFWFRGELDLQDLFID